MELEWNDKQREIYNAHKSGDENLRYQYYWYHHFRFTAKQEQEIASIIADHDFPRFIELYRKYNSEGIKNGGYHPIRSFNTIALKKGETPPTEASYVPICYFPDEIFVSWKNDDTNEDHEFITLVAYHFEDFMKITDSESECG